jgi:hypothetical protein
MPRRLAIFAFGCQVALLAGPAAAEIHRVPAGTAWDGIAAKARPGDEIVLEPGVHLPARIEGLAGEAGRPIVIRARDEQSLAEIRGGTRGLELVGPSHVEVRNIFLRDTAEEGILVTGDAAAPARGILVRNVLLARCGAARRTPAIRLSGVEGFTLADSRVQGFEDAAVAVEGAREVRLERLQVIAEAAGRERTAVRIGAGSAGVTIDRIGIGPSIQTAFAIGTGRPADPAAAPDVPLAARVSVRNALVDRNEVFAALGSAREVDLCRNTIIDPLDTALRLEAPPAGRPGLAAVHFRENLIAWTPNSLQRFTAREPGLEGTPDVEFGTNLWHSAELPAALSLLGGWEGRVTGPQRTDLDPRLDNAYQPREPAAKAFGFEARSPPPGR